MPEAEKRKAKNREYYRNNRKERDTYHLEWVRKRRLDLIEELGGRCTMCGEKDPTVLDFDHINDDGAVDKKLRKTALHHISKALHKYQVLCKNCNWRKEYWRRQHAKLKRKTAQVHASRSSQSELCEEGGSPTKRGQGLQRSR